LTDWAASYLNERLVGLGLGARMLQRRLHDPSLSRSESDFLEALSPVFTELEAGAHDSLYVEGASRLMRADRLGEVSELNVLMDMLERRVTLLGVLQSALTERDVLVRIGTENEAPGLHSLALVAAGYGLPQRRLGTVSVIGPLRMDYGHAIHAVRDAAAQLSSFIAEVYDER
jgi:heat-inducible transcriptional repressor